MTAEASIVRSSARAALARFDLITIRDRGHKLKTGLTVLYSLQPILCILRIYLDNCTSNPHDNKDNLQLEYTDIDFDDLVTAGSTSLQRQTT